jgi:hypothetical protein
MLRYAETRRALALPKWRQNFSGSMHFIGSLYQTRRRPQR